MKEVDETVEHVKRARTVQANHIRISVYTTIQPHLQDPPSRFISFGMMLSVSCLLLSNGQS